MITDSAMYFWYLTFVSFLVACGAENLEISSIVQKVPENERLAFLKRHVVLGYAFSGSQTRNRNSQLGLDGLPVSFSVELYNYYRKTQSVAKNGPFGTRENIICFPNGVCIDIDDPGVHPYFLRA